MFLLLSFWKYNFFDNKLHGYPNSEKDAEKLTGHLYLEKGTYPCLQMITVMWEWRSALFQEKLDLDFKYNPLILMCSTVFFFSLFTLWGKTSLNDSSPYRLPIYNFFWPRTSTVWELKHYHFPLCSISWNIWLHLGYSCMCCSSG